MRENATTQNMFPAYSPAVDLAKPTGKNPTIVTIVPKSMGLAVDVQAKVAACTRSKPSSILTTIISMAMMASSTNNPSDKISAPRVILSKSIPTSSMMTNTAASVRGTAAATTIPTRNPSVARLTIITTPSATANLTMNSLIAAEITSD